MIAFKLIDAEKGFVAKGIPSPIPYSFGKKIPC